MPIKKIHVRPAKTTNGPPVKKTHVCPAKTTNGPPVKKTPVCLAKTIKCPTFKKINLNKIQDEKNSPYTINKCRSIRSAEESHLPCSLNAKNGEKYCAIHLGDKNITEYKPLYTDYMYESNELDNFDNKYERQIFKKKRLLDNMITTIPIKDTSITSNETVDKNETMYEQRTSTIEHQYQDTEDNLATKLLILINDEYGEKISKLVGPVFDDVTLSEDDMDPVTFDPIWTIENGIKIAASINKYYLFSYIDSKCKIRCLTIFTIHNMINDGNITHPKTGEEIPEKDLDRAKELINFYHKKIRLFSCETVSSPEFKLKNDCTLLFKKFHIHNIFIEEKWLLDIESIKDLYQIISQTDKLISNNIRAINPKLKMLHLFKKKQIENKKSNDDTILNIKRYIIDQWTDLINAADSNDNQIPIWILATGLSYVVPEVIKKYPDIENILT